jgi:hypothetical protein
MYVGPRALAAGWMTWLIHSVEPLLCQFSLLPYRLHIAYVGRDMKMVAELLG